MSAMSKLNNESFSSVWDALEDTPEQSSKSKLKSELMICIREKLDKSGLTRIKTAEKLGVALSTVEELYSGKIGVFNLDTLIDFALKLGLSIQLKV